LFRKLKSLEEVRPGQLAGQIGVVRDLVTRLPVKIWFAENPRASDTRFEEDLLDLVSPKTLLLLDRGFDHFQFWQTLIAQGIDFITRVKTNAALEVPTTLTDSYGLRDRVIQIGSGTKKTPILTLRLIEIKVGKVWRSDLTSVLEPEVLPPYVVVDLYEKRWRIEREGRWGFPSMSNHAVEDAFNTLKRLLGLSYLGTGSLNGIKLQIWATWLFDAVLVDLGDAIADELALPFDRISLEMVDRGLYYFHRASVRGEADDPVQDFAHPDHQRCLGIVKRQRKPHKKLIVAPFPERQRGSDQFFFDASSQAPLTTCLQA